jgi:Zn-dependent peptidase ImmA (M78 family)/transcriptional regulator with XRE-family HTH domain
VTGELDPALISPDSESEVWPAAVEASRLFSAYRLQVARQASGLTKADLSKRLDISAAAISQFELGQVRPSASTVVRLAEALQFAPEFFSSSTVRSSAPQATDELMDSYGHFRSLRSVTATRRRQVLTVAHLLRDVTAFLESRVKLPNLKVPRHRAETISEVTRAAAEVRRELGLSSDDPLDDVLRALERQGIVCARYPFIAQDVSAFSVSMERRVFLVLKRHREAKLDRDRFSSCHELAHLVLHEPGQVLASKAVERQANAFAAEFLMPAHQIRDELPSRVDWPRFLRMKQRWGVSIAALLRRAKDLGVMPEATYVQAVRTLSARGWRTEEPGTVLAVEAPVLLNAALAVADLTATEVARETGWPEARVVELLTESTDARPSVNL